MPIIVSLVFSTELRELEKAHKTAVRKFTKFHQEEKKEENNENLHS